MLTQGFSLQLQQAGSESYKWRWPELPSVHRIVQEQPSRKASIIPLPSITCAMNAGGILKPQLCTRYKRQPLHSIYLRCLQVASFISKARAVLVWSTGPHILWLNHILLHYLNSRSSFCSVLWQSYICSTSNPLEYLLCIQCQKLSDCSLILPLSKLQVIALFSVTMSIFNTGRRFQLFCTAGEPSALLRAVTVTSQHFCFSVWGEHVLSHVLIGFLTTAFPNPQRNRPDSMLFHSHRIA